MALDEEKLQAQPRRRSISCSKRAPDGARRYAAFTGGSFVTMCRVFSSGAPSRA